MHSPHPAISAELKDDPRCGRGCNPHPVVVTARDRQHALALIRQARSVFVSVRITEFRTAYFVITEKDAREAIADLPPDRLPIVRLFVSEWPTAFIGQG